MSNPDSVDCITDGRTWQSKAHPDRFVQECLAGWAFYIRPEGESTAVRLGICSTTGAYQWLAGEPLEQLDGRLTFVVKEPELKNFASGEPSTLGTYRKIAVALTGENSQATKLLDEKIKEQGENAKVLQDEWQMVALIVGMTGGDE